MLAAAAPTLESAEGPIMDLGSAWGSLAIAFARAHPQRQVIGYELSFLPWLVSLAWARLAGLSNLRFHRADFRQAELGSAAVLLCYLFRRGMQELANQLSHEASRPLLISNTFALPSTPADEVITLDDLYRTRIYVYWARPLV